MSVRFPDKREPDLSYEQVTDFIKSSRDYLNRAEVGQEHAVWNMYGEYPTLPHGFVYMTDIHYGGLGVDYDALTSHVETILNTPNLFALVGGDLVDAFSPTKHPSGMMGNPISPDQQVGAIMDLLERLDRAGKLGAVQIGNHDDFALQAGYKFQTFLRGLQCPVFPGDGTIDVNVGASQPYQLYWSHSHWGNSKLNITNAAKRALQFTAPKADIALLGHTHQAAFEVFDIGGETKGAVVGGTYKRKDSWASKWGMSKPGFATTTVMLWPDQKHFEMYKDPLQAAKTIEARIIQDEAGETSYQRYINR